MIAIIDYGMGNVKSVYNALEYLGYEAAITSDAAEIDAATHIILPGVGAFGKAISNLNNRGLRSLLVEQVFKKGKPFLGICLGLQLLAQRSFEHGKYEGLGWISGEVRKFELNGEGLKTPHMGWNDITVHIDHPVFADFKQNQTAFYFVHSFHMVPAVHEIVAATCEYGYRFAAAIAKGNILATQFHPEKSQDNGLQFLDNYVKWNPRVSNA